MFLHKNVGFFSQLPILYFRQVTVIPTISFYQNDPYLNYVVLNINGDTALSGNNNTFLDSGFRNISPTSNVTQGTFSPFSPAGWSGYFDGSSYLNLTASGITDFGANPYTFECYLWLGSTGANQTIYDGRAVNTEGANFTLSVNTSAKIELVALSATLVTTTQNLLSGNWNHIAVCRTATTAGAASVYINGVQQTFTDSTTYVNPRSTIGASANTLGNAKLNNGYISNLRIVKGTALYTTNFTPNSAEPLKLLSNTSLLTLQDNRFVDNSRNNFTLSATGTPQVQPFSPIAPAVDYTPSLHGGSAYFDGNSYLSINNPNTTIGSISGNFTIDCWINWITAPLGTGSGNERQIIGQHNWPENNLSVNFWAFFGVSTGIYFYINSGGNYDLIQSNNFVWNTNVWYHLAVSRFNGILRIYVNGIDVTSGTGATTKILFADNARSLTIGADQGATNKCNAYISNLRIVKGQAVYTSNFTPPSRPVTATSNGGASVGTTAVPNLSVTPSLLLDFHNGGIIDRSYKNDVLVIGDSKTQTLSSKFGTGSLFFDGTGDYLAIPSSDTLNLATGDFTVEAWINTSTIATGAGNVIGRYSTTIATNNDLQFAIYRDGANLIVRPYSGTTNYIITVGTIAVNTWYHVALVRSGNTISGYLNGVLGGTPITTITGSLNNNINWNGVIISGGPNASVWNGYIEDIRITKGIARYTANFTPPSKLQANNSDPYYSNVVLFLDGNNIGSNVNNEFRATAGDAARLAITRTGATTQGSFSPFSPNGWSGFFNGSTNYLTIAGNNVFNFGSSDWTVEAWVYLNAMPTSDAWPTNFSQHMVIAGVGTLNSSDGIDCIIGQTKLLIQNNDTQYAGTTHGITINTWNHLAYVRNGNTIFLYVNGVSKGSVAFSGSVGTGANTYIGCTIGNTAQAAFLNGYISNLRIVKGLAVYTSPFTPPTGPLPALSGSGFSTSLLTLQDNRFKDNSPNNFTLSVGSGTPTVQAFNPYKQSTAYSPTLHGGSGYFDGSSYLTIAGNTVFNTVSSDWTLEAWVYLNAMPTSDNWSTGANQQMVIAGVGTPNQGDGMDCIIGQTKMKIHINDTLYEGTAHGLTSNTWNHLSYVRSNNFMYFYVNGILKGSVSVPVAVGIGSTTYIGCETGQVAFLNGYISNLRIVKGRALYTSNFTPPTSPVTAVNGTSLLLNFDNGYAIDSTGNNVITTVGNSRTDVLSTAPLSSSTGSLYFDGSSYISVLSSSSSNYDFGTTGQFTIECWINKIVNGSGGAGTGAYDAIVSHADASGTAGPWGLYVKRADNKIGFYNGSTIKDTSASITNGVWTHIAVVRNSTNLITFINGVSSYNVANTDATNSLNRNLIIGWDNSTGADQNYKFNGYIDDLRITKSVARYTSNFTPQTYENPTSNILTYPTDPYRNLVVLDLNADAVNNEQNNTFLDRSGNNLTITRTGSTTQGSFSPFSPAGWSGYFDGSSYLTIPDNIAFKFGTQNFTIEAWVNFPELTTSKFIANKWNVSGSVNSNQWSLFVSGNIPVFMFSTDGNTITDRISGSNILANQWYHIAAVRNGNDFNIYVNGLSGTTVSNSGTLFTAETEVLGISYRRNDGAGAGQFTGYVSNLRIVKGQALYTSNFTPPTAALTTTSTVSGVTLSAENVSLLTLQDNRFKDNSNNNFTITPNGTPSVKPFSPFQPTATYSPTVHGGSGYFNGGANRLTVPANILSLNLSAGDFTVECWLLTNTIAAGESTAVGRHASTLSVGTDLQYSIYRSGSNFYVRPYIGTTVYTIDLGTVSINTWYHVALVRSGNTFSGYLNGIKAATQTVVGSLNDNAAWNSVTIGGDTTRPWNGYISNLRVVKGVAITPPVGGPTAPVQAVSGTSLLLNFDNAGVVDSTGKNNVTTYSTSKVDYVNSRYGSGALKFNGTSDYMQVGTASDWTFLHTPSAKWTIEFWVYNNSTGTSKSLLDTTGGSTGKVGLWMGKIANDTIKLWVTYGTSNNYIIDSTSTIKIPLSTWTHVAITYDHSLSSNNMVMYFNGLSSNVFTKTANTPVATNPANALTIGSYGNGSADFFNGAIDELRITNAVRYNTSFVPLLSSNYLPSDYVIKSTDIPVISFIVAGGGGGAGVPASAGSGSGGGAGGVLLSNLYLTKNTTYTVTVGAGGAAAADGSNSSIISNTLSTSNVSSVAIGGGGGITSNRTTTTGNGRNGGSGGGGGFRDVGTAGLGGSLGGLGTFGQGFDGGLGWVGTPYIAGGGGGAGGVGANSSNSSGGRGGLGIYSAIDGTVRSYAGGGGGGGGEVSTTGGIASEGGGAGGTSGAGTAATVNTGGGGGGAGGTAGGSGGAGGSGVVVLRYPVSYGELTSTTGATKSYSGNDVIYKWTSGIGSFTV